MAKEEKENNLFSHTLWNQLQNGDNSYCGIKIKLSDFANAIDHRVYFTFPIRIPFDDFLLLQSIDQYCQDVFGNMHI
jgi:hypothetical protein